MRILSNIIANSILFGSAFLIGGYVLMPYLPPYPERPITIYEWEYWVTNWAGLILGIVAVVVDLRRRRQARLKAT